MSDGNNYQGGRLFGQQREQQEAKLDRVNAEVLEDDDFKEVEDLPEKLEAYKAKFLDFDVDDSGDITFMGLKLMLEKLGQAKTHLEVKKMIREVDKTNTGTISYREFIDMMLGPHPSVLKLILLFEEKAKSDEVPSGPPPKKSLEDLP
ncbi:Allograft inflammatory factor 1 [Lamellibrachia satsuma]|nr:Allograft inflammatory factor 1 [Lamellibrachia satsuma]